MITGATHPLSIGVPVCASADDPDDIIGVGEKTAQRSATQRLSGAKDASRAAQSVSDETARAARDAREGFTPMFPSILSSSRWVQSDHIGKLILVTLLALKDRNGFVWASIPGLAHQVGCTIEDARKWIEVLKSPDPLSRSKAHEGRTIEEINGGFKFLNNSGYLDRARKRPMAGREGANEIERDNDNAIQYNRSSRPNELTGGISPIKRPVKSTSQVTSQQPVNWHPSEFTGFNSLENSTEREFFLLVRGFAELAATRDTPEPDFPLSVGHVSKKLKVSKQWVSTLRTKFVRKGIITATVPYSREESKSARYRWALETTLPIPPMPESDEDNIDIIGLSDNDNPF